MIFELLLYVWLILLFALGAVAGSFLNVCIYRLPYEKSVLWPGSRCPQCLQAIRWYDNLPLISFWVLRGRCRVCGAHFTPRYFVIELLTGLAFAGLFYAEVIANVHRLDAIREDPIRLAFGLVPYQAWLIYFYHVVLFCFLLVASVIDIDHLEIPMPVTMTGTVVGLIGGALLWPWVPAVAVPATPPGLVQFKSGIYAWPVWHPLPSWLPPDSWRTGLATGLAGVGAGVVIMRGINFLFKMGRGREGIGMGDADLMMMVGSFLGWQAVVVATFVAVFPGLVFGIIQLVQRGDRPFPFGPALAAGSVLTWLGWQWLNDRFPLQLLFFDATLMLTLAGMCAVGMLLMSFLLRLLRGRPSDLS
ncbi:MAG TPA: prepilin peptidase [Gemmataceae bacterium]|nr:prepilin peptidase [Gemmataceae bacterium]